VNSCSYYDIFNEFYARLNVMIETMNERHECLVTGIRECGLFHETNPSLSSLKLEVSLYNDYESSFPLESNFVVNTPSTDLEEAIDPPLTHLSFVAPSSPITPRATTAGVLTLLISPILLAHCTGLEIGEPSRGDANFVEDDLLVWLRELTLIELYLVEAPFGELCGDSVMFGAASSFKRMDLPCVESLGLTLFHLPYFPPTPLICVHFTSP